MSSAERGAYGPDDDIVDYILGITYEIWEQRGVDKIHQYYSADTVVYTLEGIIRGADTIVSGTQAMLEAYPDRLLLGDDVIWSGDRESGYYSSHRITSPMMNLGATAYGPATGKAVRILTIADCFVEAGVITLEWLVRDNHALVTQLGFEPLDAARQIAENRNDESREWIANEVDRLVKAGIGDGQVKAADDPEAFAYAVVQGIWRGDSAVMNEAYAPYAVMHRSPISWYSGRDAVADHYAQLRGAFSPQGVSVDHVAVQPFGQTGQHVAVRWTLAGEHRDDYLGVGATGRPVFVLGVTHWRIIDGRIAVEWTVFDGNAVLSQLV